MKADEIECKVINGFPNYLIDNTGKVYNRKTGCVKTPTSNGCGKGYLYVDLYNDGKRKRIYVHRLVAEHFIPNLQGKPYVNHIDGNSRNNSVANLEWCTPIENVEHAAKVLKTMRQYVHANELRGKPVYGVNVKTGEQTRVFKNICEAGRSVGAPVSNIVATLKGRQSHAKGFVWYYANKNDNGFYFVH